MRVRHEGERGRKSVWFFLGIIYGLGEPGGSKKERENSNHWRTFSLSFLRTWIMYFAAARLSLECHQRSRVLYSDASAPGCTTVGKLNHFHVGSHLRSR